MLRFNVSSNAHTGDDAHGDSLSSAVLPDEFRKIPAPENGVLSVVDDAVVLWSKFACCHLVPAVVEAGTRVRRPDGEEVHGNAPVREFLAYVSCFVVAVEYVILYLFCLLVGELVVVCPCEGAVCDGTDVLAPHPLNGGAGHLERIDGRSVIREARGGGTFCNGYVFQRCADELFEAVPVKVGRLRVPVRVLWPEQLSDASEHYRVDGQEAAHVCVDERPAIDPVPGHVRRFRSPGAH